MSDDMQADNIESHSGYNLRGRGEIIEKLRRMQKSRSLITAQAQGYSSSCVTTVVNVIPEKGLVLIDISENKSLNKQLLGAEAVKLSAQVEGIHSHFMLHSLTEATWQGHQVFAAPFPDSLYWLERRRFFRVKIPMSLPVKCSILMENGIVDLSIIDLSISGLAVNDKFRKIDDSAMNEPIFEKCSLFIPGHGTIRMGMEIRYRVDLPSLNAPANALVSQRVGCLFHNLHRNSEITLQRFVYEVELEKKRRDDLVRKDEE